MEETETVTNVPEVGSSAEAENEHPADNSHRHDLTDAEKLLVALEKMSGVATTVGLTKTAQALEQTKVLLGFEAAGYRIPNCAQCSQPRGDETAIRKINRDRETS